MNLKIIKRTWVFYIWNLKMLKTIVEFKFDDYQLYDQNLSAEDRNTLVQKTEDIAQYIYSILKIDIT